MDELRVKEVSNLAHDEEDDRGRTEDIHRAVQAISQEGTADRHHCS